jgi:hypothetical protein
VGRPDWWRVLPRPGLLLAPELGDKVGERHATSIRRLSGVDNSGDGWGRTRGRPERRDPHRCSPGFRSRRVFDTQLCEEIGQIDRRSRKLAGYSLACDMILPDHVQISRLASKPRQPKSGNKAYLINSITPCTADGTSLQTSPPTPGPSFALKGPDFRNQESCEGNG